VSGALTYEAVTCVSPKTLNVSIFRPELFPQPTTFSASSRVGMLITHSLVAFKILNVKFRLLITQPTIGGSNSIIVHQDIVMMFAFVWLAGVSSTTGPGSSKPQTLEHRKGFLH